MDHIFWYNNVNSKTHSNKHERHFFITPTPGEEASPRNRRLWNLIIESIIGFCVFFQKTFFWSNNFLKKNVLFEILQNHWSTKITFNFFLLSTCYMTSPLYVGCKKMVRCCGFSNAGNDVLIFSLLCTVYCETVLWALKK